MFNVDSITNEKNKEHNKKWPFIPDRLYRILIIGGSGSGKTNALLNLISQQDDIDKIYLYAKNLNESNDEFLIKNRKDIGINHLNDPNAFIECSNTMDDAYENIDDYNSNRKRKILIVFDEMIAAIMTNKKISEISAYSFGDLRKYEHMTGEDLGYKPSVAKQAKFDYSLLGKFLPRGWIKMIKKKNFLRD